MAKISIQGKEIKIMAQREDDYISLTDIARSQMNNVVIIKWLSLRSTIEYLGEWECLYNPSFNSTEFGRIKNSSGSNNFVLSVKQWIEKTGAIGLLASAGRYGSTFAHRDIAFHFGMWISPKFQLLLVKEYQRLKAEENSHLKLNWNLQRVLSKINYKIHTDAIKEHLIPQEITNEQASLIYANEADLLNVALFGMTANEWKAKNVKGNNLRDEATLEQLVVLSNLESINSMLVTNKLSQVERIVQLNKIAIVQMKSLLNNLTTNSLKELK